MDAQQRPSASESLARTRELGSKGDFGVGAISLAGPIFGASKSHFGTASISHVIFLCISNSHFDTVSIYYLFGILVPGYHHPNFTDSHRSIRPAIIGFMKVIQTRCHPLLIC